MPRSRCGSTSTSALVELKELLAVDNLDDSCAELHRGHPRPASRLETVGVEADPHGIPAE
jgi:hypothetical protein